MSKLVEIIEDKQVIIDKSDLDFIYNQIEEKAYESYFYKKTLELACGVFSAMDKLEWDGLGEGDVESYCDYYLKNKSNDIDRFLNVLKQKAKEQLKNE